MNLAVAAILLALPAQAELRVGVVALSGSTDPEARLQATQILIDALAGMRGISVVSLAKLDAVLGPAAKHALDACTDDRCVVATTAGIKTDRLALGSLDDEGDRTVLRLRLVRTSSAAEVIARVTRDLTLEGNALAAAVSQSALELFPEQAKSSLGTLEISGAMPGARIVVDKKQSATVPLEAIDPDAPAVLRLPPGLHQIQVTAPGHFPATERAEVLVGQRTRISVDLRKNRSNGPVILAAAGGGALLGGIILGAIARNRASDWEEACPSGIPCAPTYTRERYLSDEGLIDRNRTVANVLYGVAGAAAIGAVVWFFVDPGSDPEVEP